MSRVEGITYTPTERGYRWRADGQEGYVARDRVRLAGGGYGLRWVARVPEAVTGASRASATGITRDAAVVNALVILRARRLDESRQPRRRPVMLTEPQRRALAALDAARGPAAAREVAQVLWPDSPAWDRPVRRHDGIPGGRGATMPMKAGRLLWQLQAAGLVTSTADRRWLLTGAGRAALADGS